MSTVGDVAIPVGAVIGSAVSTLIIGLRATQRGVVAAVEGASAGAQRGAVNALNGTAEAVKRIETTVGEQGRKLDEHIARTAVNAKRVDAGLAELADKAAEAAQLAKQAADSAERSRRQIAAVKKCVTPPRRK